MISKASPSLRKPFEDEDAYGRQKGGNWIHQTGKTLSFLQYQQNFSKRRRVEMASYCEA